MLFISEGEGVVFFSGIKFKMMDGSVYQHFLAPRLPIINLHRIAVAPNPVGEIPLGEPITLNFPMKKYSVVSAADLPSAKLAAWKAIAAKG